MSAPQGILHRPVPGPSGPPALPQTLREVIGDYHTEVGSIAKAVAAVVRFARTRRLEITVLALLVAWWVALALLVNRFMPLATVP
jgi:hypothetical protein